MYDNTRGIPNLPDLTHPQDFMAFGGQLFQVALILGLFIVALGIVIAIVNFSLRGTELEGAIFTGEWIRGYSALLKSLPHIILVMLILVTGFFTCSTLANRYHHWELAKIAEITKSVSGQKLVQMSPNVYYFEDEPHTYQQWIDGKLVQQEGTRKQIRYLNVSSSDIKVKVDRIRNRKNLPENYRVDFIADYTIINPFSEAKQVFFESFAPYGYSLVKSFRVARDGTEIDPNRSHYANNYRLPINLEPQIATTFRVKYQAEGGQSWVYDSAKKLLSDFNLSIEANFPNADFASGIAPSNTSKKGNTTVYNWSFVDNVSVSKPFGVFTATESIFNTGIMPRLLLLSPGIFLWWLLLLYLSVSIELKNIAIAGGLFFACIFSLTYFSRLGDPIVAWTGISLILLASIWGLGSSRRNSSAVIICTIAGAILPVLGLLVPYSGLTLSLAGLLSTVWLAIRHWSFKRYFVS